jgi:hypothetical protein
MGRDVAMWLLSTATVFGALFGVGWGLLLDASAAAAAFAVAAAGALGVFWLLRAERLAETGFSENV